MRAAGAGRAGGGGIHGPSMDASLATAVKSRVIDPGPAAGRGYKAEPEMDRLENIIREFNDRFGNIEWKDRDRIDGVIAEELPAKVAAYRAY